MDKTCRWHKGFLCRNQQTPTCQFCFLSKSSSATANILPLISSSSKTTSKPHKPAYPLQMGSHTRTQYLAGGCNPHICLPTPVHSNYRQPLWSLYGRNRGRANSIYVEQACIFSYIPLLSCKKSGWCNAAAPLPPTLERLVFLLSANSQLRQVLPFCRLHFKRFAARNTPDSTPAFLSDFTCQSTRSQTAQWPILLRVAEVSLVPDPALYYMQNCKIYSAPHSNLSLFRKPENHPRIFHSSIFRMTRLTHKADRNLVKNLCSSPECMTFFAVKLICVFYNALPFEFNKKLNGLR